MSTTTTPPTPDAAPPEQAEPAEPAEQQQALELPEPGNRRESRYRARARDAEAALTAAQETHTAELAQRDTQIVALQTRLAEEAISAAGIKPRAVWAVATLADVIGPDGLPDATKVTAAITAAKNELGVDCRYPQRQMGMRLGVGQQPHVSMYSDTWTESFTRRDN